MVFVLYFVHIHFSGIWVIMMPQFFGMLFRHVFGIISQLLVVCHNNATKVYYLKKSWLNFSGALYSVCFEYVVIIGGIWTSLSWYYCKNRENTVNLPLDCYIFMDKENSLFSLYKMVKIAIKHYYVSIK